ncbi:MAG: RNA chaperone Hfq [Lautropia sp.]|nr:RNA chaperone Hfq [Lautropia sp.]
MLNSLRRARTWVDVYLITGTCLHGQIKSFDTNMLLLQTRTGNVALYHHAISSVIRAQKRSASSKSGVKSSTARSPRKNPALGHVPSGSPPRVVSLDRPRREPLLVQEGSARGDSQRLSRSRLGASRRPPEVPAGVVVVRHKRARTIVKPEDADD